MKATRTRYTPLHILQRVLSFAMPNTWCMLALSQLHLHFGAPRSRLALVDTRCNISNALARHTTHTPRLLCAGPLRNLLQGICGDRSNIAKKVLVACVSLCPGLAELRTSRILRGRFALCVYCPPLGNDVASVPISRKDQELRPY